MKVAPRQKKILKKNNVEQKNASRKNVILQHLAAATADFKTSNFVVSQIGFVLCTIFRDRFCKLLVNILSFIY